jgi:hypothetical protein
VLEPLAISGTLVAVIVIAAVVLVIIGLWMRLRKVLDEGDAVPGGSMGRQMTDSLKDETPDDYR